MRRIDRSEVVEFRYRELYKKQVVMDVHLCRASDPAAWGRAMDIIFKEIQINRWKESYLKAASHNDVKWTFVMRTAKGELFTFIGINDFPENWDPFWVLMETLSRGEDIRCAAYAQTGAGSHQKVTIRFARQGN